MSPIGRIFVVVNLALAALFVGWASATLANSHKYRSLYDQATADLEQTRQDLQEDIDALEAAKQQAERERSQIVEQKNALQTERDGLEQELASLTDEKNRLLSRIDSIDGTLGDYNTRIADLGQALTEAGDARAQAIEEKRNAESEREAALQAQRDAQSAAAELEKTIADLQERIATGGEEIESLNTKLEAALAVSGLTMAEIGGDVPTIQASVLGVMSEGGLELVHLNKGTDAGVKRGFTFYVYDGARVKGRARVEVVNATTSTAVVVDTVEGRTMAQGDRAATRF